MALASRASASAGALPLPLEEFPQQGAIPDLVAGLVATETAASSPGALLAGGAKSVVVLFLHGNVEEARLLLQRLLRHGLVEDPLASSGVIGVGKGLGIGGWTRSAVTLLLRRTTKALIRSVLVSWSAAGMLG